MTTVRSRRLRRYSETPSPLLEVKHQSVNDQSRIGCILVQWQEWQQSRSQFLPNRFEFFLEQMFGIAMHMTRKPFASDLTKLAVDCPELIWIVKVVNVDQ